MSGRLPYQVVGGIPLWHWGSQGKPLAAPSLTGGSQQGPTSVPLVRALPWISGRCGARTPDLAHVRPLVHRPPARMSVHQQRLRGFSHPSAFAGAGCSDTIHDTVEQARKALITRETRVPQVAGCARSRVRPSGMPVVACAPTPLAQGHSPGACGGLAGGLLAA